MSERTDEEQGTQPERTEDWIRDLEGASDADDAQGGGAQGQGDSPSDPAQER